MNILFLDQSGNLGGAELSLSDVAVPYRDRCLVGLFADGPFREHLEQRSIPVEVLTHQPISIQRESGLLQSLSRAGSLFPLILKVTKVARNYDLIYANTQKSLVIGAIASVLARRPLVYHLRDILSSHHFSATNRRIAVFLANRCAALVFANSEATRSAFIEAGGIPEIVKVVYNGFTPKQYQIESKVVQQIRQDIGQRIQQKSESNNTLNNAFIIGHFSRLSPWKGQHILIDALARCPSHVVALLVGDALFGEQDYVNQLQQQVSQLGLQHRVHFLGFRSDVPQLMAACDLITHTSTDPEPFGRVIVEGMLCNRPVIATAAGGAVELIQHGKTGWMCAPNDANQLAKQIMHCYQHPDEATTIAHQGKRQASQRFNLHLTNQTIAQHLDRVVQQTRSSRLSQREAAQ